MASYGLVQLRYSRSRPSGQPAEDIAVNTLHCQVTDGGWTTDDRDAFESTLSTLWTAIAGSIANSYNLAERRYYNLPATTGPSGDPAFVVSSAHAGTGGTNVELPPQCAMTITLKTAIRRRWGRIYLPGLTTTNLNNGRFSTGLVDQMAVAFDNFFTSLRGSAQGVVIWHRQSWTPETVEEIRVDDVVDVQRRRRFDSKFYFVDRSLLS